MRGEGAGQRSRGVRVFEWNGTMMHAKTAGSEARTQPVQFQNRQNPTAEKGTACRLNIRRNASNRIAAHPMAEPRSILVPT